MQSFQRYHITMDEDVFDSVIYSKNAIEFVTVANQFCLLLESCRDLSRRDFIDKTTKILPLLYLKGALLEPVELMMEEPLEQVVTEEDYLSVQSMVALLLGQHDDYLEVFHPDIQFSDTPIRVKLSENMADIYQDLKNLISLYQMGSNEIMNDALAACVENFRNFWGQQAVNALRALHNLRFGAGDESTDDDEVLPVNKVVNESFVARMQKEWQDENDIFTE